MSRALFLSQLYADIRRTDIDFFAHPSIWYSNKVGASRPSTNAPLHEVSRGADVRSTESCIPVGFSCHVM